MDFPMDPPAPPGGRDRRGLGAAGSGGTHSGGDAVRDPERLTSVTSKAFELIFNL